jgi:glycosyltransferase involved in cell wall biosynthesis
VSEIILIDDGSFDGTSELLSRYAIDNPTWRERVQYSRQENHGPGAARNNGVARAKGEWLAFIDNDDLWLPQNLEWQFRALARFEGKCGACISDAWFMNNPHMKMTLFQLAGKEHGEQIGMISEPLSYMLQTTTAAGVHPVWLQNLVTRTDLARRAGGFDPDLPFGDDDDFVFRLGCETNFCFVNMPMVLIDRTPPSERHVGVNRRWDDEDFRLQMAQLRFEKRVRMSERFPAAIRNRIREDLAAVHSGWANWFLETGEFAKASVAISEAVKYHVTPGIVMKAALIRFLPRTARRTVAMRRRVREQATVGVG